MNVTILYGDGIHDDTEAYQAWLDGKLVYWPNGVRVNNVFVGPMGQPTFLITNTLTVEGPSYYLSNCYFRGTFLPT